MGSSSTFSLTGLEVLLPTPSSRSIASLRSFLIVFKVTKFAISVQVYIAFKQIRTGLDIGLVGPVARGASRFENLLAPQKTYWPGGPVDLKTYWPPKKLTGPYLKTKLARRKTICINLQFAHRPIIKLFRSHPRNIFQILMVILKKKKKKKKKKLLARRASRKSIVVARTGPTT